jgi:hypothetical protein
MRVTRSRARGYVLLAVLLVLAALVFLVAVGLRRAGDEGVSGALVSSEAQAQAVAELGLERTRAYLGTMLEREVDLDRALDPALDTDCTDLLNLQDTTPEDHLPTFTDGDVVTLASSGKPYRRVTLPGDAGAYLVRIDDNDDDGLGLARLFKATTSNHNLNNCIEGLPVGGARTNLVRDRDRTVWVTVIGLFPGSDPEKATARRTLRVLVGPGESAGIVAGGTVDMRGASHVCGAFGDVMATGSVEGGCLCGSGCSSGPSWQSCGAGSACNAQSGGATCSASSGGANGTCSAGVSVPPPPRVSPWDVSNAPPACTGGVGCMPFYYLRNNPSDNKAQLLAWNYSTCPDPREGARICGPGDCGSCWVTLAATAGATGTDIRVSHLDSGLLSALPHLAITGAAAPLLWKASGVGYDTGGMSCAVSDTSPYPGSSGLGPRDTPLVTFEYRADPGPPTLARLPRGIWFVEGNVRFEHEETPDCVTLTADPLYGTSIIATGDIVHTAQTLSFVPASDKGFVLLAGRDFHVTGGNARLYTCGDLTGVSGVVMAHEQFRMTGNQHVEAQVVVENAATCSDEVTGAAIEMSGNATINVSALPPVGLGQQARTLLVSESTH